MESGDDEEESKWNSESGNRLLDIAKKSQGLSGRSLRKLPLLAHAWFVQADSVDLDTFLDALDDAVIKHMADTIIVEKKPRKP